MFIFIKVKELVLGALLIALGVLFPIVFHTFGLGTMFLPMFYPMILSGFFLPPFLAVSVGVLMPITSSLLTQLPPLFLLPVMIVEGFLLTAFPAFSRKIFGGKIWLIVLIVLLLDRIVVFMMISWLAPILNLPANMTATAAVLNGLPGIVLLVIFIPIIVRFMESRIA